MKMLMFDFRDSEKSFFQKHNFQDIEITFIKEPLNISSQLRLWLLVYTLQFTIAVPLVFLQYFRQQQ